jgi:CRISPR-associated protein Csb2
VTFTITAELPLGTYRGRAPDGTLEPVPSVTRLHAALLSAAGFGPRAVAQDDGMEPSPADDTALRWLEEHPPDAIRVPSLQINASPAIAYRDDGTLAPKKSGIKKLGKHAGRSVAAAGRFSWTWHEVPPSEVATALEALCPDVSHLGTTESPVRLWTTTEAPEPTHRWDKAADLFAGTGDDHAIPAPGRTTELRDHHSAGRSRPTTAKDRVRSDEVAEAPAAPRRASSTGRYAPVVEETDDVPWSRVLVLPLNAIIPARDKVRWAVAAHRGLIRLIGEGAPPILTGTYPEGVAKPANRVAWQILDPGHPATPVGHDSSALLMMIPREATPSEVAVVMSAVRAFDEIRGPKGRKVRPGLGRAVPGARFWQPAPAGALRLWRTDPAAVPDTRGRSAEWTFLHAALLSLGFVWKDAGRLGRVHGRGADRDRRLVDAVNAAGVAVVGCRPLFTSAVQDFVHHVHPHAVVRPYQAVLALGGLTHDRTLQALGQSRHLGGGLLVPVDVPEGSDITDVSALAGWR